MPVAFFGLKLKAGVRRLDYENWLLDFGYSRIQQIPSVVSQQVLAVEGNVFGGGAPPFDFIETLEFTNIKDYLTDLQSHPAAKAIAAQLPNFVHIVAHTHGHFIPPGVKK